MTWVKVVRPRRIERVVQVHTALRDRGLPVPPVRGWSPEGLLVLDNASGVPATDGRWLPEALLDELDRLRAQMASADIEGKARTSLSSRLSWYAERLRAARPDQADLVNGVARRADAGMNADHRIQTIHGDLHLGQLFVDESTGEVTGLIDVDTAGAGNPADDAAAFIGHAIASAVLTQEGGDADTVWTLVDLAVERWAMDAGTRALIAIHLLGHALAAAETGVQPRADLLLSRAADIVET
nr:MULTISPECIES: phosphotransferase [Microbacterium]